MKYKDPQSPKIPVLEQELVRAEAESLVAEAQLSNITREQLKAAFNYQFDATRELAEKYALIAGYGKALELLDDSAVTPGETRPAYDGYEASKQIIMLKMLWLLGLWIPLLSNQLCLLHQEYDEDELEHEHGEIDDAAQEEFNKHDENVEHQ